MAIVRSGQGLARLVRSDIEAWARIWTGQPDARVSFPAALHLLWTHAGLQATTLYRLSHALHATGVKVLPEVVRRLNIILYGFDIPSSVAIGPGLYVPHPVGTVVMAQAVGRNLTLVSGVTIGLRTAPEFPTIGNDVYVGAGARVLGPIRVGNNVSIGANAVVLKDVPDNSVAVGVPATIRARGDG